MSTCLFLLLFEERLYKNKSLFFNDFYFSGILER